MSERTPLARLGLGLCLALSGALALHYVFLAYLTQHLSVLSLLVFAAGCALLVPAVRRLPVLRRSWVAVALFLFLAGAAHLLLVTRDRVEPSREKTAFVGATLLTGHRGSAPLADGVVLVGDDGRIEAVGPARSVAVPDGYTVVDLTGRFLLPGLINAHAHLLMTGREPGEPTELGRFAMPRWLMDALARQLHAYPGRRLSIWQMEKNARLALQGGVTTLRGLGDPAFADVEVRHRIETGRAVGPRLLASGPILCVTGGHAHQIGRIVDGPDEARRAVREALSRQVDHIKIASTGGVADSRRLGEAGELQMTPEEIAAITDEAHRKNILVAAHAESTAGVLEALRAGVDSIEHGAELDAEAIRLFKRNPKALRGYTTLHPTLSVVAGGIEITEEVRSNPALFVMSKNGQEIKRRILAGFEQAVAGGVTLGVGTDAGIVRHDAVWKEMLYMVEHGGLSNAEALYVGTLGTAESIGVAEITGSLDPGKFADLLVVESNPVDDLTALDAPLLVVASGVIHELR